LTYRRALFQPISAGGNSIKKLVEQLEVEPQMPGLRVREGNAILRARFGRESRMGAVPSVLTLGVLLTAATVAAQPQPSLGWLQGPPPPVQPEGETNRVISKGLEAVGERYRGAPAYYNDGIYGDVIGVFFGLLAAGSYARARELRDGVCAAWRAMPRNGPFTGRASVGGVDVDLDRMCGLER
jgi:hypothetical protein